MIAPTFQWKIMEKILRKFYGILELLLIFFSSRQTNQTKIVIICDCNN